MRSTLVQLVVVAVLYPLAYFLAGAPATLALLSGAACALVPHAYFALRMARAADRGAARAARLGMAAATGKFLLSVVSFALVFALLQPQRPGLVFVGFGLLWLVQLAEGIRLLRQPQ